MGMIPSKNPWAVAGGLEPQRGDLWCFDMRPVVRRVREFPELRRNFNFPAEDNVYAFARDVVLPEVRITGDEFRRHSAPSYMPGQDQPLSEVRVNFIVGFNTSVPGGRPVWDGWPIYDLLEAWRRLTRIGRFPMGNEEPLWLPSGRTINLSRTCLIPDLQLVFLRGLTVNSVTDDRPNDLEMGAILNLRRCWLSGMILNGIDQSSSNFMTATATIYTSNIEPATPKEYGRWATVRDGIAADFTRGFGVGEFAV